MRINQVKQYITKVIQENKFGMFDISDVSQFGSKYKTFIDDTIRSNKNLGAYVGYSFKADTVIIIQEKGMTTFDVKTQKPISSLKIWK